MFLLNEGPISSNIGFSEGAGADRVQGSGHFVALRHPLIGKPQTHRTECNNIQRNLLGIKNCGSSVALTIILNSISRTWDSRIEALSPMP